jgi:hypothetical protein
MYFATKFYYSGIQMTGTVSGFDATFTPAGQHWRLKGVDVNAENVYSGLLYINRICTYDSGYNATSTHDITGTLTLSDLEIYGDRTDKIRIYHSGYCNGDSGKFYTRLAFEIGANRAY